MNLAAARVAQVTPRYLYSANRLKYPLIRKRLIELWREAPQATQRSGTGVGIDYERSAKVPELQTSAWARRVYPLQLAGTKPADCRR
ncbi:hypothetical protein ACP0HM_05515 [Escherichia coli]